MMNKLDTDFSNYFGKLSKYRLTYFICSSILVHMNGLDIEKRGQVLGALCEGNSVRSITRMFGVGKNTVARLLIEAGAACAEYQDKALRNLRCKRIQCD